MDNAFLVGGFERFGDLEGKFQGFLDENGTALDPIRQCVALNQFQDEEVSSVKFFKAVNSGIIRKTILVFVDLI